MKTFSMDDIAMVHIALQKIDEENMRARRQFTNVSNNILAENLKNAFEGMRRLTLAVAAANGAHREQATTGLPP